MGAVEIEIPGEIKRREVELGSQSWMDCLVGDRSQERSRGGRWSWALIAGWIVLLLTDPREDEEEGGGAGLSQQDGLSYS